MIFAARFMVEQEEYSSQVYNESQETIASMSDGQTNNEKSPTYTEYIFIAIYCLIFMLGIFPNSVITYLLFTRKFMRLKYIFTATISIAHITFCCICIPVIVYGFINVNATAGTGLCQAIVCLTFSVTLLSMLATAIRRALAMSERFRYANFTYRGEVKNIFAIWLFSLLLSLPYICIKQRDTSPFDLTELNEREKHNHKPDQRRNSSDFAEICYSMPNISSGANCTLGGDQIDTDTPTTNCVIDMYLYSTCVAALLLFASVLVSLVLQTITMIGIKKRPNQMHWLKEIRITKQHIIMLIIFLICWVPLCIVSLVLRKVMLPKWLLTVLNVLAASSVIYNPYLYYLLNAHIRRELKLWLRHLLIMFT